MATVRFFNVMRDIAGTPEVVIGAECRTVRDAVDHLAASFPKLGERLFDESTGALRAGVAVLLDGRKMTAKAMDETPLAEDAELSFFEIVGGG